MKVFLRSRVVEWWLLAISFYWLWGEFLPGRHVQTVFSGLLFSAWLGAAVTFWGGAWHATHDPDTSVGGRVLLVNLAGAATGVSLIFGWSVLFQYLGQPDSMRFHPVRNWFLWMIIVSVIAAVSVAFIKGEATIPSRAFGRLGLVVALIMAFTILLAYVTSGFAN